MSLSIGEPLFLKNEHFWEDNPAPSYATNILVFIKGRNTENMVFFKNMNNLTPRINHVLMYPQNIGLQLKFATYLPSILSSINNAVHIFSKFCFL